jgi:hypothetical protein
MVSKAILSYIPDDSSVAALEVLSTTSAHLNGQHMAFSIYPPVLAHKSNEIAFVGR